MQLPFGREDYVQVRFQKFRSPRVLLNVKVPTLGEKLKSLTRPVDFCVEWCTFSARGVLQDREGVVDILVIKYEPSLIGVSKALLIRSSEDSNFQIFKI